MFSLRRLILPAVCIAALTSPALAQQGPPPEVRAAIRAIEQMLQGSDDASLRSFAAERLAPAYRQQTTDSALFAHLRRRRAAAGHFGDIAVERMPDGMRLLLGAQPVVIEFALDGQHRVTRLELGAATTPATGAAASAAAAASADWAGLTWETLDHRFSRWETAGFSGAILARRNGSAVMRKAYGFADRSRNVRTSLSTIYGIGSTPIDFTRTGILLLAQRGRLSLADTIGRYIDGVPANKRTMTLEHLMSGRSGLPDFHGIPEDWDADLAWIDRTTAVRRILTQPLAFAPGTSEQHSHSAFGLLAAVIEIVSGKQYAEFTRAEFFAPLGMTRTGFYGERGGFEVDDFAVGAGPGFVGLPNIPPNWGPTSWLVMGSGGMYSTLDDMARFYDALESGRLLTGEWARRLQGPTVGVGGSDRGFFIFRITTGRGDSLLGLMNSEGRSASTRAMMQAAQRLVFGR